MNKKLLILTIVILLLLAGIIFYLNNNQYELPNGETTTLDEENEIIGEKIKKEIEKSKREIFVTDGIKHSVPIDEIREGGPPKDGIPSIDDPKFITVDSASEFLSDDDPGISISIDGVNRFYPFDILVWHELVNDKVNGKRILISYCPLCLSGIVFDPIVDGKQVEFGTSGKLWNSNLVMYDRKTDSLWSQILGEAILGEKTGTILQILPSDQIRFGKWRGLNPDGEVLSKDTGAIRTYGYDPYGDYYTNNNQIISPVQNSDGRLENKDFILGIVVDGKAKAYLPSAVKEIGEIEEEFAGKKLLIRYESDVDTVRIFEDVDGKLIRINPFPSFWFSWVAVHPDTDVFK